MPKKSTSSPKRCAAFSNAGISRWHGPHHVAQKLMTTGLPRTSVSCTVSPVTVVKVKFGARLPTAGSADNSTGSADTGRRLVHNQNGPTINNVTKAKYQRFMKENYSQLEWKVPVLSTRS